MSREPQSLGDIFSEEEDRLAAEASTPERIAADQALAERTRIKAERELESLRAQGMLVEEGEESDEEDEEDEGEGDDPEATARLCTCGHNGTFAAGEHGPSCALSAP